MKVKRIVFVLLIMCIITAGAWGADEDLNFSDMKSAFNDFATGVAGTLPMASTIGLQWSTAHIGQFPHLGIGLTAGAALMPISAVSGFLDPLGLTMDDLEAVYEENGIPKAFLGFPIPAYSIDFRLGGFVIPFDIGFKVGFIPEGLQREISYAGVDLDYLMLGGDVRFRLVKEKVIVPRISVGGGYTYMRGSFNVPGILGDNIEIGDVELPDDSAGGKDDTSTYTFSMEDPSLGFRWQAHTIDLKAQVSKKIIYLFTPYIGVGASYARSQAGGGMYTDMIIYDDSGNKLSDEEVDDLIENIERIKEEYPDETGDIPELTEDGFTVQQWVNGFTFRAYGGISINLWVLKTDFGIMYNFIDESFGAQLGVRLQF